MDFTGLKKEELLTTAISLENKLQEQKHLAEAVEAKDKEIVELKKAVENAKVNAQEAVKAVLGQKDTIIASIKEELGKVRAELEQKKVITASVDTYKKEYEKAVQVANGYINNFRSYLKAQQGTLELAVELELLLSEKIGKKE